MVKIIRVAQGKNSTLSHLYFDNLFVCYLLEDPIRPEKIPGITCIPEGEFRLQFNTSTPMHKRYTQRFPHMHRGMIEITGIPEYSLVFIHIGNDHTQTAGCPLTGAYWRKLNGDYQVTKSEEAYRKVYPRLVEQIEQGNDKVVVCNRVAQFTNTNINSK